MYVFLLFYFEIENWFRFPFNWKNPIGCFFVVLFEYIAIEYFVIFPSGSIFFSIGYVLFSASIITKSIENDLKLFNENTASDRLLTLKLIADFIETHSTLKKLSVFHTLVYQMSNFMVWKLLYGFGVPYIRFRSCR